MQQELFKMILITMLHACNIDHKNKKYRIAFVQIQFNIETNSETTDHLVNG